MRCSLVLTVLFLTPISTLASTIWVPDHHSTIQAAILATGPGDEVIVRPGTYVECIDFQGKAITVRSEAGRLVTTIDGNQMGSVVSFVNGESASSRLEGFTITNGLGSAGPYSGTGAGVHCDSASPTLVGNEIAGNLGGEERPFAAATSRARS